VVLGSKDRGSLRRIGGGLVLAGAVTLGAWGGAARADTIIFDNFNDVPNMSPIGGRTPTVDNGHTWVAPMSTFVGNNLGGLSANTKTATTASIDLGMNFLSSNPGLYDLSLDMTQATGGSSTTTDLSWVAVGFAQNNDAGINLVTDKGAPWMLYRYDGDVNVYAGPGISGSPSPLVIIHGVTTGVVHNFKLELDTTKAHWTLNAFVDGTSLDLNGVGAGDTFTYGSNPIDSHFVAMGTGVNQNGGTATVDNFQFVKVTPLPSAAGMAVVGFAGLLVGRRRGK
jgi:hypothetical protein